MKEMQIHLSNLVMCAEEKTPFQILSRKEFSGSPFITKVARPMGVPELLRLLVLVGIILAIVVIMVHITKLLIVNYPKTVTQTKQKVVHAVFVIVALCMIGLVFDTVIGIVQTTLGITSTS